MHKTILIVPLIVAGVAFTAAIRLNNYVQMIQKRFPHLDKKVIRKAYLKFIKNAYQEKYGPMSELTDEQMDTLFLSVVQEVADPK